MNQLGQTNTCELTRPAAQKMALFVSSREWLKEIHVRIPAECEAQAEFAPAHPAS